MYTPGSLTETQDGEVTIVVFGNELKQIDELNVNEVGQALIEMAEKLPMPNLVLDMGKTEFFGSSFIEVLFRVWKKLNTKPAAKFGIACLPAYCREVLEITHLNQLWPLFETRQEAIDAFK